MLPREMDNAAAAWWRYATLREAPLWLVLRHPSRTLASTRDFFDAAAHALNQPRRAAAWKEESSNPEETRGLSTSHGGDGEEEEEEGEGRARRKHPRSVSPPLPQSDDTCEAESAFAKCFVERWRARRQTARDGGGLSIGAATYYSLEHVAMEVLLKTPVYYTSLFRHTVRGDKDRGQEATRPICLVLASSHFLSPTQSRGGRRGAATELAGVVSQLRAVQDRLSMAAEEDMVDGAAQWRAPPRKLGCIVFGPVDAQAARTPSSSSGSCVGEQPWTAAAPGLAAPSNMNGSSTRSHPPTSAPLPPPSPAPAAGLVRRASQLTPPFSLPSPHMPEAVAAVARVVEWSDPAKTAEAFPPLTLGMFDHIVIV